MFRQTLSRSSARSWSSPKIANSISSGDRIILHKVKIQPSGRLRRAFKYTAFAFVGFYVWREIALLPLNKLDLPDLPVDEKELEPLFIPFPFTTKQVQPLPYAGAGEEWQSFLKFNKDTKLRQRVKDDLILLVKKAAEKNALISKWANTGEGFRVGGTWLVLSFPERPPPEYVRWGMELDDDGLFIRTKKVDARTKALLDRVLMPYPVAAASYAFAKAMVKENANKVVQYLGYQQGGKDINTSGPNPELAKKLNELSTRQTANGSTAGASSAAAPSPSSPSASDPSSPAPRPAPESKSASPNQEGRPLPKDSNLLYATLGQKGSGPWQAFVESYKKSWKPLKYYPPRGSLAVHGMIALDSPKGRVYIDVFAWYHPKTDSFHQDSMTMSLRSISPANQKPRR